MVMYPLESPHWSDSNENTQRTIIVWKIENTPKLSLFASWRGTVINPQWLELPMVPKMFEPLKFDCSRIRKFAILRYVLQYQMIL